MRAELDKQANQVSAMFDEVAEGYDRTRSVPWLGQMGRWGRAVSRALELLPGQRVLDVAAGTGTSGGAPGDAPSGRDCLHRRREPPTRTEPMSR